MHNNSTFQFFSTSNYKAYGFCLKFYDFNINIYILIIIYVLFCVGDEIVELLKHFKFILPKILHLFVKHLLLSQREFIEI